MQISNKVQVTKDKVQVIKETQAQLAEIKQLLWSITRRILPEPNFKYNGYTEACSALLGVSRLEYLLIQFARNHGVTESHISKLKKIGKDITK